MRTLVLSGVLLVLIFTKTFVDGALTISYTGSNEVDSTTYSLKCEIPGFSGQATMSKNGTLISQCFTSGCITLPSPPYSFRQVGTAIYVDFSTLAESEDLIQWTCAHDGDTSVNFNVEIDFGEATTEGSTEGTLTISYLGSNKLESTTYTLQCKIPGFNGQASWSKEGSPMVSCFNSGCLPSLSQNYQFSHDSSAIYVSFISLTVKEHDIQWKCEHGSSPAVYFTVEVDSTKDVMEISSITSIVVGISCGGFSGLCVVLVQIVLISGVVAKKWCFPNLYDCRGTVIYGLHIAIVGAVCHIASLSITMGVVIHYYGQFNTLAKLLIGFLTFLTPCLGVMGFLCIVTAFGKKELIHKIFDDKYERLSLKKSFGVKFNIHNSGLISFKIKTKKDAHIAVFGSNYGAPLVDIILGFRDKHRSVVMEPNQLQPKDEKRGEVISSTEYKTVNLKCEQNHLTLLNGNEETILTWKRDKNTSLEIKDIVISNSIKEHAVMTKKSISRFTERDIQGLCKTMSQKDKYSLENPEQDTTFWNDVCYSINQLHDKDDQRTADEIREMWEIILSASKWTLPGDSTCQFDSDSVLKSYSWIDTETEDEELESPGYPESGEWISLVRQGDRLDERDDDARCFKNFLLVIVVVFPIAWLVLLIIGLWRWCKKDDSTSNRENGIHECEYSCLRGSFCNKTSHLDKQKESSDNPLPYTVKYNRSDVRNKSSKKSQSNDHDSPLAITVSTMGKEKGLKPITGVNTQNAGESKLNQKPFGTAVPLPSINSS